MYKRYRFDWYLVLFMILDIFLIYLSLDIFHDSSLEFPGYIFLITWVTQVCTFWRYLSDQFESEYIWGLTRVWTFLEIFCFFVGASNCSSWSPSATEAVCKQHKMLICQVNNTKKLLLLQMHVNSKLCTTSRVQRGLRYPDAR